MVYFISRMLLLRHSAATRLHSHQLSEAEADHHQIWLADKTLRCVCTVIVVFGSSI